MIYPRHFLLLIWSFILAAYSVQAKPTWTFSVVVAVEKQTADFYQTMLSRPIQQIVRDQMATINANFNSSTNFNGIYNFQVDSIYVFDGPAQTEVTRPHPPFQYCVVIDGKFTEPTIGGGWYGSYQTIYHSWPWSNAFASGPFGSGATDGLTHEFGHSRGAIDLYGLRVEGSNNPINGETFEPVNSIMNFPYGNIVWDEYTTHLLNSTADGPIEGDHWITSPFPTTIRLKTVDAQGLPLPNVTVQVYPVNWSSYAVTPVPVVSSATNSNGVYSFPTNPFQPSSLNYPWHIRYSNFLIKATYNAVVVYKWMPLYDVQNTYFDNGADAVYTAELQFPITSPAPVIRLSAVSSTSFCQHSSADITVSFTVSGSLQPDNVFTLQLSDANGDFTNGHNISTVSGTGSATLTAPIVFDPGTNYRIRVISSRPYAQSDEQPIRIKPAPDPPGTQSINVCQYAPAPVLQATGQNLLWYDNVSDVTGSTTAPTINTDQPYSNLYYVSQTVDGCESYRSVLAVNVWALPMVSAVASVRLAPVGSVVSLTATGGTAYQWASSPGAALSNPVTSPVVTATLTSPGIQTFTVLATNGHCVNSFSLRVEAYEPVDLSPIMHTTPSTTYGMTTLSVVVDVVELNGVATGEPITVKVTRDARLSLSFPANDTTVGGRLVQNSAWMFSESAAYYELTTTQPVQAPNKLSFGLIGTLDPGSTTGTLSISTTIIGGQREVKLINNSDADKVDYFQQ